MRARTAILLPALTVTFLLVGCATSDTPPADPFAGMSETWNAIEPGGDTLCSDGTPYRFFVHPGNTTKLMVYFEGGGACWFRLRQFDVRLQWPTGGGFGRGAGHCSGRL